VSFIGNSSWLVDQGCGRGDGAPNALGAALLLSSDEPGLAVIAVGAFCGGTSGAAGGAAIERAAESARTAGVVALAQPGRLNVKETGSLH